MIMDLGLLKWLKETRFYERIKKKILYRHALCAEGRFVLRRKEEFMNFSDKGKFYTAMIFFNTGSW